jgi:hypothetical protein
LKQIHRTSEKLAALLWKYYEAADAMARAARPELYQERAALATWPTAPPVFQGMALEIQIAAERALAKPLAELNYV